MEETDGGGESEAGLKLDSLHKHYTFIDKYTIQYRGKGDQAHDVGVGRAIHMLDYTKSFAYFEMTVVDPGAIGAVSIGLVPEKVDLTRQPGWEPYTYGYHGDDGRKFHNSGTGSDYGPRYGRADTVGCGYIFEECSIFFTKNGNFLGHAFSVPKSNPRLFPAFGMHSKGEVVTVNLGQRPFAFQIEQFVAERKRERQKAILYTPVHYQLSLDHVVSYLGIGGYSRTLQILANKGLAQKESYLLKERSQIRRLILDLKATEAKALIKEVCPAATERDSLRLLLDLLVFCELLVAKDTKGALLYARGILSQHRQVLGPFPAPAKLKRRAPLSGAEQEDSAETQDGDQNTASALESRFEKLRFLDKKCSAGWLLEEVVAILAYPVPAQSKNAYFLSSEFRFAAGDAVNRCVVGTGNGDSVSAIEKQIRQVDACEHFIRDAVSGKNWDRKFNIKKYL